MRKSNAREIRRLQKKLIPVNLLVCILCIVASLSLFLMPIVKINLATIVGDETLKKIVTDIAVAKINTFIDQAGDSLDGAVDGAGGGSEEEGEEEGEVAAQSEEGGEESGSGETGGESGSGENPSEGGDTEGSGSEGGSTEGGTTEGGSEKGDDEVTIKDLLKEIDVRDLVSKLVNEIFGELKADVSVSARNSLTVFMAKDKAETLLNELFFNEASGFITNLEKTLVKGFGNAFNEAGKLLQGAVVKAVVVPALKENLPKEYADLVDAEELQTTIDNLDNAKSAQEASDAIIDYIDGLADKNTEIDRLTPEQKADVTKQITELYDKTVAETGEGNFSVEAMISVTASEMLGGVSDFDLSKMLAGFVSGGSGGSQSPENPENPENTPEGSPEASLVKLMVLTRLALVDGEPTEGSGESVEEGAPTEGENTGSEGDTESGGEVSGETGGEEKEVKKYTTYRAMGEGLAQGFMGDDLSGALKSMIKNAVGGNEAVFGYYGYIFIGIGFFILLWMILFLFAFFHMFAKNKRFMMWYVKLFCAWPCIIFYLLPLLIKKLLATAFPGIYASVMDAIAGAVGGIANATVTAEQASGLFNALLSAFQTFAWISGICYLLLWIISICWAFPIKHKIRKLKKGY